METYFTAVLFCLSPRHLDGRQKKCNFEAAKKSVDKSFQYFRYYMNCICSIASEVDAKGKKVKGISDSMIFYLLFGRGKTTMLKLSSTLTLLFVSISKATRCLLLSTLFL